VNGLYLYGFGHIGAAFTRLIRSHEACQIWATARTAEKRADLTAQGINALDPQQGQALITALGSCDRLLISAPPDDQGCPAFLSLNEALKSAKSPKYIGYLSTTGVYGDRDGGWVFEDSQTLAQSVEAKRRLVAEAQWLSLASQHIVCMFRLPGLYGPGHSVFDRLRSGEAKRVIKYGQVFSRLHEEDCATALLASIKRPRSGAIYNLCDDAPVSAAEVLSYAATTYGFAMPPLIEVTALSPKAQRFYDENKRVSNALAKAELDWQPIYSTYKQGLEAIFNQENEKPLGIGKE